MGVDWIDSKKKLPSQMEVAPQYTQKLKALEIICTCEIISGKEKV